MDFDFQILIAVSLVAVILIWDIFSLSKIALGKAKKTKNDTQSLTKFRKVISLMWGHKLIILNVLVPLISILIFVSAYSPAPRIESSYPKWEQNWEDYSRPIELRFNVPVETSKLKPFLSNSELSGRWEYLPYLGFLPVTRVARYYPETTLPPNRRLVVYMTGVARLGIDEYHEHPLNLFTHTLPEISSVSPPHHSTKIPTDTNIVLKSTKPDQEVVEWSFEIVPEAEFSVSRPDDITFVITPAEKLSQSETYSLKAFRTSITRNRVTTEIIDRDNPELVHELIFSTVRAPLTRNISPNGTGVMTDSVIDIEFELDMNKQSVEDSLSIFPALTYTTEWLNGSDFRIIPSNPFPKDTKYTIKFPAGLRSLAGGVSEQDIEHSFTTIGAVKVDKITPANNLVRVLRTTNIAVKFNQEVNHSSAQAHFSITPKIAGNFSWKGNTMIFNPKGDLNFNTNYTVTIKPGVKTVYGLDSVKPFTSKFRTIPNVTIVKGFGAGNWDRQDYNFSCGVAAMKMALTWKGFNTSEYNLIYNQMGIDTSTMSCNSGVCYWGNPNRNYLGQPNGSGTVGTGQSAYGVHWLPVKRVFENNYGITTQLRRGWNVRGLAAALNQGHPVQIWWWNGVSSYYGSQGGRRIDWIDSQTGQSVEAIHGMHSVLVVGFTGDPNNPTNFIVLDPWWGYNYYPVSKFYVQWPKLGNTGLIIY